MGPFTYIPAGKGLVEETPVANLLNRANEQLTCLEPPSPKAEDRSLLSVSLRLQDIYECRAVCFENPESDGERLDEAEIQASEVNSDCSANIRGNKEEKGGQYFVVYPFDEEDEIKECNMKLKEEEETCLALNMSVALCIKKRKWVEGGMTQEDALT